MDRELSRTQGISCCYYANNGESISIWVTIILERMTKKYSEDQEHLRGRITGVPIVDGYDTEPLCRKAVPYYPTLPYQNTPREDGILIN